MCFSYLIPITGLGVLLRWAEEPLGKLPHSCRLAVPGFWHSKGDLSVYLCAQLRFAALVSPIAPHSPVFGRC